MLEDLFCENFLTIQCTLGNKIKVITLIDIYTTAFDFINKKFAEIVCKKLEIQSQHLIKPKPIQRFDSRVIRPIIHVIFPMLFVENYTESLALLFIIKLGQHFIILGRP